VKNCATTDSFGTLKKNIPKPAPSWPWCPVSLPDPDDLKVDYTGYLNGLGDTVGELRRYLLDSMRRGDLSRCEELLSDMDDIYTTLVTMDFPDAITGGLRHTTDQVRGILEKTRGDITLTVRQQELERKLNEHRV
jgi:translin